MSIQKILIVDDEENIRALLNTYLNSQGYETILAKNGQEVFEILEHQQVDLVFLDIQMPGMNGVEILKRIKQTDPEMPTIMISGNATVDTAKKTLDIGAFDYIKKPVDLEKVSEVIYCVDLLNFDED